MSENEKIEQLTALAAQQEQVIATLSERVKRLEAKEIPSLILINGLSATLEASDIPHRQAFAMLLGSTIAILKAARVDEQHIKVLAQFQHTLLTPVEVASTAPKN